MSLRTLLLGVLLLCLIPTAKSKGRYALNYPLMMKSGDTEKVCMTLNGYDGSVELWVGMEYQGENITIFSDEISLFPYCECNDVLIPTVQNSETVVLTLSISGGDEYVLVSKQAVLAPTTDVCFFQMNKNIYKPGDKVRCRIICLNIKLHPVNQKFEIIYLRDPSGARIAQWLHQETESGLLDLEFDLIDDAAPGGYYIITEAQSGPAPSQWINVEEYVPPRLSVTLSSPSTISVLDEFVTFSVSSKYVHGRPVPGKVLARWRKGADNAYGTQRNCYNNKKGIWTEITGELDSNGNFQHSIDLLPFHLELMPYPMSLSLEVTVIEDGTGFQFTRYAYVGITSQLARIDFDYGFMLYHYKEGIPYPVRVSLVDEKNLPLANEEIQLDIEGMPSQNILTDANGKADYLIDTTDFAQPNFTIRASYPNPEQCYKPDWYDPGYGYPSTDYTVYRFHSESGSFVQVQRHLEALICGKNTSIEVQYILTKKAVGDGASMATFFYMLMAQSKIVHNGKIEVSLTKSLNGFFSIEIEASYKLGPSASIIVFCVLKTDLIMDTVDLSIEPCLQNEVAMNFSKEEGLPGAPVDIMISASPNSLCALKVIDKRLLLMNPYDSFTLSAVFYSQLFWTISGYYVNGLNFEDPEPICKDPNKQIFCKGGYYVPVSSWTDGDTYQKYQSLGLVCVTNNNLRRPVVCGMENYFPPIIPFLNGKMETTRFLADSGAAPIVTVRQDFSETFSWVTASVDSTGHVTLTRDDVPDSVTEWEGSTFCLSKDKGLGMTTKPAVYRTFLAFFVDYTPPYYIRRGEILQLRMYTSNYLEKYIKVIATLQNSTDFEAESKDEEMEKCAPPGGRVSYIWHFNFLKLGDQISISITAQTTNIGDACDGPNDPSQPPRMDTVIKTLHVKPEGIKKELTSSNLVYLEDSSTEITITVTVPQNMVPDSLYAYVIALGDPFGLPLKNLRNLLPIPQGSCLPNVALLESALCVLDYMNSTNQLSEEDKLMAISSIQTSYYLLLRFRMWNGGFTNFYGWAAELDVSLSVEVFCVLIKARRVIYVDPNVIEQLVINMVNKQDAQSGCMKKQNGDGFDYGLTAKLFIGLKDYESSESNVITLMDRCMTCLKSAPTDTITLSDRVKMCYAFTVGGEFEHRETLLNELKEKAITEGGTVHLENDETTPIFGPLFYPRYASDAVEMTAFFSLCIIDWHNVTQDDKNYASMAAVWLARQMTGTGGFWSPRGLGAAMKALTKFAKLTFIPDAHHILRIIKDNNLIAEINMDQNNRLLVQRFPLPDVPGTYSLNVTGKGGCLVQCIVQYNVPVPKENATFFLDVGSSSDHCINGVAHRVTLNISYSYEGSQSKEPMAIIEVDIMSGYNSLYESLSELQNSGQVAKAEEKNGKIYIYLKSVSRETKHLTIELIIGCTVLNLKDSSVYIYDPDNIDENGYASYGHPCPAE